MHACIAHYVCMSWLRKLNRLKILSSCRPGWLEVDRRHRRSLYSEKIFNNISVNTISKNHFQKSSKQCMIMSMAILASYVPTYSYFEKYF